MLFTTITNCRLCKNGQLTEGERLIFSEDNGAFLQETGYIGGEIIDLDDGIIAPGYLELHTNGVNGFHFTHFESEEQYVRKLEETAKFYLSQGVTGFWVTIPTVEKDVYMKILPLLKPRPIPNGATLLGAHIEGPYLQASKRGAHDASLFQQPSVSPTSLYGSGLSNAKLATLAPELPNSLPLIKEFLTNGIKVSLGHSAATYAEGLSALNAGATCLTHILNAMSPFHHREPGLAGLISLPESSNPPPPYFSILGDGIHLHPTVATILWRAAPHRAILVSDSIELAGLPDGVYPGHAQIPHPQVKVGPRATIQGTDTLIGACCTVADAVKNLIQWSECGVAEAVRCVSENVVMMMSVEDQFGTLKEGRRADFVVLEEDGSVKETWMAGRRVWSRSEGFQSWSPHD